LNSSEWLPILRGRFPLERSSPNATPVGDVVQAFMFNCLWGGRRFAQARRVQDDQALAVNLGMKKGRLCSEDALYRLMEKVPREQARTWLASSERDLYAAQSRCVRRRFGFDREYPIWKARGRRMRV
jgi:hypothetical protein